MDYKHLASNVCETFETLSAEERVDFLKRITGEQYVSVTDMELQREALSDNEPNNCDNLTDADVKSEYNGVSETQEQNQLIDKLLLDANTRIVILDESSVSCTEPQSSKKAKKTKEKARSILTIEQYFTECYKLLEYSYK
ncbi:hypothetical protein FB645_001826 [Coemansia sp. IMI 203386]|nr:hypothetical protein FB645_001826 [Coemansia sp. IMI 203386]